MAMIRRFVNIVAEDYTRGLYSLHRLDVSKLFYPSRAEATQANTGGGGDEIERLPELPSTVCLHATGPHHRGAQLQLQLQAKTPFFGLLSPSSSESRFFSMNEVGQSAMFNADQRFTKAIPELEEFKGHVLLSASVVDQAGGAKVEGKYILHGVHDAYGLDFKSRFDVLRFGHPSGGWYWQSLPPPPFIYGRHEKAADPIISYAMVEDGRTICLSVFGEDTYCFNTAKSEWWKAGDWMLPFHGGVVYDPDLKLWLGFSNSNNLCATSGLSKMALNQPPKVRRLVWKNIIPDREYWRTIKVNLINMGSGKFAVAEVFKFIGPSRSLYFPDWDMAEDEFVVLTGLEVFYHNNNLQRLRTIQHKSIRYMCDNNRIHDVL